MKTIAKLIKSIAAAALCLILTTPIGVLATNETGAQEGPLPVEMNGTSAILMDSTTGKILLEHNADDSHAPASITKIMTMLLTLEAVDSGKISMDDMVTVSEHAKSFGGSTIFLEQGEQMSVHDMLKGTAVASANDAAVALGEFVAGSEPAFVEMMNKRAAELGMTNTQFKNAHGLDEEGHCTTARDIAKMSAELMRHEQIFEFSGIWMDSLRNGATELVNTNKLIRFYQYATGLKTGTTSKAGSCISATAKKDGLHLIAVVLGAPNGDKRNATAKAMLEYGFANWALAAPELPQELFAPLPVKRGIADSVAIEPRQSPKILVKKGEESKLRLVNEMQENLTAPVELGQRVGTVKIYLEDEQVGEVEIVTSEQVGELSFGESFKRLIRRLLHSCTDDPLQQDAQL